MKKSSEPAKPAEPGVLRELATSGTLELPVAPHFVSHPPRIAPHVMLERIAETMPWRSSRPGERERRRDQGIAVEFVL
jgi:hypothetical protein